LCVVGKWGITPSARIISVKREKRCPIHSLVPDPSRVSNISGRDILYFFTRSKVREAPGDALGKKRGGKGNKGKFSQRVAASKWSKVGKEIFPGLIGRLWGTSTKGIWK